MGVARELLVVWIPEQPDHPFRTKSITDSGHADHLPIGIAESAT